MTALARAWRAAFVLSPLMSPAWGEARTDVKGVNPAENISRLELIPKLDRRVDRSTIGTVAFKYDQTLSPNIGVNLEMPLVAFRGSDVSAAGLGDVQFRMRYIQPLGRVTIGGGVEFVAPSAGEDALGRGKWQVNPSVFGVYAWSPSQLTALIYKHINSVAGDAARRRIDESNVRILQAYLSPEGWWLMGDLKLELDHVGDRGGRRTTLVPEIETGTMLSSRTSISLRLGSTLIDRTTDFTSAVSLKWFF